MEKNLTNLTVRGNALQLDCDHLGAIDLELGVKIHRIDILPKGFVKLRFIYPGTNESLRVLVMEDFRPDYELITKSQQTVIINASNPEYPIKHRLNDDAVFLYMGILPGKNVSVNNTVEYEFEVTQNVCQRWIEGEWSSIGCGVSVATTPTEETVCECNHLSIFAAAFPVPPQEIDPFNDTKLFLTIIDNPLVVTIVVVIFIVYLLLVLWGRYKDNADKFKGRVVVLEDNFPDDAHAYLVAVHTSARINAGTSAHVGIRIIGKMGQSRAHILSSEWREVLTRNSDDWFMIYTPRSLGDIYRVHVWHDNYGSRPSWFCEKIVVYDLKEKTESIFIVDQWLSVRRGEFPEANLVIATDADMLNMKRIFLDNSILGFRNSHIFLSVFVRHPRSQVTRVQRVSTVMCSVMVVMLCNIMFYKPDDPDGNGVDDYQYSVEMTDFLISLQTLIITAALTICVLMLFRRSYTVMYRYTRNTVHFRRDEVAESLRSQGSIFKVSPAFYPTPGEKRSLFQNYVQFVHKYLRGHPLAPVHISEGDERMERRTTWFILAWMVCIAIIAISSYLIMLYGLKLGFVQSQKWLTSLVMSEGGDIFILSPGKVIASAIFLSMAFQVSTKVDAHGIRVSEAIHARPQYEYEHMAIVLAKRNHPMYTPISASAILALLKNKEIREKWWNLIDFMNAVCCMVIVSYVNYRLWISSYHSVSHLHTVFTDPKQIGSIGIKDVSNISLMEQYLEMTFIEVMFNSWWYNGHRLHLAETAPSGIQRYWIADRVHKPISKPLIRQVRVVPHKCSNAYFPQTNLLLKWSLMNKDDNIYGEEWVPATFTDMNKKRSPWEYTDRSTALWWTNQRFYGTYGTLYDVSGYDTFLGPRMKEAQKTLAELRDNDWQDWYTRACFLQIIVYNVNEKTFSQVTLLFEYFVDGSMFTSATIIPVSREIVFGIWELLLLIYAVYYVFRAGYLINLMGFMGYLKTLDNVIRIVSIILSFSAIIIWCVHHHMSITYSEDFMRVEDDDNFDFDQFISTFNWLKVILSVLLCFIIARVFTLFRGGRRYLNVYYTLTHSLYWLWWLTLGIILLTLVCVRLQYFIDCQEYFRIKELILPKKMTSFLRVALFEHFNVILFVSLRSILMYFLHAMFVVLFLYYFEIAKTYKLRDNDSFNFVLFVKERIVKFYKRKRSIS